MQLSNPVYHRFTDYVAVHTMSNESQLYAYILWMLVTLVFLLISILHISRRRFGVLGAIWNRWAMRKLRRRPFKLLLTRRPDTPARPAFFPSNGCLLGIVALFIAIASLALVGPDYIVSSSWPKDTNESAHRSPSVFHSPEPPDKSIAKSWWTSAGRAGILSFALLPLCVIFALKSSPFAPFSWRFATQLHFDKLGVFHRWTARFIWLMTTLHVALWSVQLSRDRMGGESAYAYAWQYERFIDRKSVV